MEVEYYGLSENPTQSQGVPSLLPAWPFSDPPARKRRDDEKWGLVGAEKDCLSGQPQALSTAHSVPAKTLRAVPSEGHVQNPDKEPWEGRPHLVGAGGKRAERERDSGH